MSSLPSPFGVRGLAAACRQDPGLADAVATRALRRAQEIADRHVWITLCDQAQVTAQLEAARARLAAGEALPLFGVPFAVKDNIDVEGLPTTAACPSYAYTPEHDAAAVSHLRRAGAIQLGKTNMDQFATGLVGTRSPYGGCASAFDARYVSGGSSSGSGLAVALGAVSFALGTDTAGSGRVPAAFNNVVGLKPTRGLISTRGVVPACRSLDCVSVFAGTSADAAAVLEQIAGFDSDDPYSRRPSAPSDDVAFARDVRFGVLSAAQREFQGDATAARMYEAAVERMRALGAVPVEIDYEPFARCARLLYETPFVAERYASVGAFLEEPRDDADPVVRQIVLGAREQRAAALFTAFDRLRELSREADATWRAVQLLLLPTVPTHYTVEAVQREPLVLNAHLGHYTNFVNLLDLCGVAVPAGIRPDGLPFGVTLLSRAFRDSALLELADRFHRADSDVRIGATDQALRDTSPLVAAPRPAQSRISLAVCGAHLAGQPLHHQLSDRRAQLVARMRTARDYRFYALDTTPKKPGLVRVAGFEGPGIEVEVWSLAAADFGSFVSEVPPPLVIGKVALEDGSEVSGFLCEPRATEGAREITELGGWLRFVEGGS